MFVTDMAARRAELSPNRVAFREAGGREWTFAEVDRAACRLARALHGLGAMPGDRVAVLCLNRVEFFVLLFACLKAELILVPLNWRQPVPELLPVVRRADPRVLFHDQAFGVPARMLAGDCGLIRVPFVADADESGLASLVDGLPASPYGSGRRLSADPWYLLFTSGTTGMPKAVIQTFAMTWANAVNIGQAIDLTSVDTSVSFLPLFHTAGINLYALPIFLAGGMSIVLPKFDADAVIDLIKAGSISAFFGVPAVYQALSLCADIDTVDLGRVRSWGCGGAALPEPTIHEFARRGALIQGGMGMTETGPTVFLMDAAHVESKLGSVGKAQILAEVRLIDTAGRLVSGVGVGELQIRGPGVTPGYFGDKEATVAAFAGDGWLKTGDVAARDVDGYYFIIDRIKDMFISGGENVYPAEVERVLSNHPDVLEAVVVGVDDDKWGEVGIAFLIPRPGCSVDRSLLGPWCRERLAAYKVPNQFEIVADLPRTAAGKVQKHILKEMLRERS